MIRKLREADRRDFLRLSEMFYSSSAVLHALPRTYHEGMFEELMRSDRYAEGYVAELEGAVIGYALLAKTFSREAGGKVMWLEEMYILPEYRSHGIGKAFFSAIEEQAEREGFARIRLELEANNLRARALYERLGYRGLEYKQMVKELRSEE